MASMSIERKYVTSEGSQTENVESHILWQCLYVIKTMAEFQNLSYQVTRTHSGQEIVVVHHEGTSGILGPPIDPITLTVEPSGSCLVNILFRPVQRVTIVAKGSGCIEIASLMAVLRLVAGKGYVFCPGLPEVFLAGKLCKKFVTVHHIPFKRYQSNRCLVYYQLASSTCASPPSKKSILTLCQQCMMTAKLIRDLPVLPPHFAKSSILPLTIEQQNLSQLRKVVNPNMNQTSSDCVIVSVKNSNSISSSTLNGSSANTSDNKIRESFSSQLINPGKQLVSKGQIISDGVSSQSPSTMGNTPMVQFGFCTVVDPAGGTCNTPLSGGVGEFQSAKSVPVCMREEMMTYVRSSPMPSSLVEEKMKAVSDSLKQILREKAMKRLERSKSKEDKKVFKKETQRFKKNVCRICKKEFSTENSLQNHYHRHEGYTGTRSIGKRKTSQNNKDSSGQLRIKLLQRSHPHQSVPKKLSELKKMSGTTLRLMLKCVNDIMPTNTKSEKGDKMFYSQPRIEGRCKTKPTEIADKRGMKRSASSSSSPTTGFTAMQTLLDAAALENQIPSNFSEQTASDSSFNTNKSLSSIFSDDIEESSTITQRKVRKCSRLASKAKDQWLKILETLDNEPSHEQPSDNITKVTAVSFHDSMTNLNLLSTVSLQKAMDEHHLVDSAVSRTAPIAILSPLIATSTAFPTTPFHPLSSLTTTATLPYPLNCTSTKQGDTFIHGLGKDSKCGTSPLVPIHQNKAPLLPLLFAEDVQVRQGYPDSSKRPHNLMLASSTLSRQNMMISPMVNQNTELSFDCGAIDLTKPKASPTVSNIPVPNFHSHKQPNGADAFVPESVAQYLKLIENNAALNAGPVPLVKVTAPSQLSSKVNRAKQADGSLQARIFASSRDYRLEGNKDHDVVASTSRVRHQNNEQSMPGAPNHNKNTDNEIQCGYKWSGSGGLVKERTQIVRELVPSAVIANYLSRTGMNHGSSNLRHPTSGIPPCHQVQVMPTPLAHNQVVANSSASPAVLNLSTGKAHGPPALTHSSYPRKKHNGRGHPRKSQANAVSAFPAPSLTAPLPPLTAPVPPSALASPHPPPGIPSGLPPSWPNSPPTLTNNMNDNNPRCTLHNTLMKNLSRGPRPPALPPQSLVSQLINHRHRVANSPDNAFYQAAAMTSLKSKVDHIASTNIPSPTSLSLHSISSPSLAAILLQPVGTSLDFSSTSLLNSRGEDSTVHEAPSLDSVRGAHFSISPNPSCNNPSNPDSEIFIKNEPSVGSPQDEQRIIMTLPCFKGERVDSSFPGSRDGSPNNLIVDMSHHGGSEEVV